MHIWTILEATNTVNTDEFGAWEAENQGIYSVCLPLVARITVFPMFFASGRAKTLVFTQFTACCVMSFRLVENAKNTVFYDVFAPRARKKEFKKRSKKDILASDVGPSWGYVGPSWRHVGPSWCPCWAILELCWANLELSWANLALLWGLGWAILTHLDRS